MTDLAGKIAASNRCLYTSGVCWCMEKFAVLHASFACVGGASSGAAHLESFAKRDFFALS